MCRSPPLRATTGERYLRTERQPGGVDATIVRAWIEDFSDGDLLLSNARYAAIP
jgi:hypothetical protein